MSNINQTALIAYHTDCLDGFTSAWIVCRALERKGYKCDLIKMDYTPKHLDELFDELIRYPYEALYIVDYSVPTTFLQDIQCLENNPATTILDHHKTAFEMYCPDIPVTPKSYLNTKIHGAVVILDNSHSGAGLCWEYFTGRCVNENKLVTYVEDWDLWRFDLGENTKYIHHFLLEKVKTLVNWDILDEAMREESSLFAMLKVGAMNKEAHDDEVNDIACYAVNVIIEGEYGLAVECPRKLVSDVGHTLAKKCGTYGAMYTIDLEENLVYWSFRSVKEEDSYDVEVLAKKLGGGGHKNAARTTVSFLPVAPVVDLLKLFSKEEKKLFDLKDEVVEEYVDDLIGDREIDA